jgi:signal recognition particle receptor subunit beta
LSTQNYYVILWSGFEAGKTEFIRSVSDLNPGELPDEEVHYYQNGLARVKISHCVIVCGRVKIDHEANLFLVTMPPLIRFDYPLLKPNVNVLGFVFIFDSTNASTFKLNEAALKIYRYFCNHIRLIPYVVAASNQDHADAWGLEDLRIVLKVRNDEILLPCNTHNKDHVKQVLLVLLDGVKDPRVEA